MPVDPRFLGRTYGPYLYEVGLEKLREFSSILAGGFPGMGYTERPEGLHPWLHDSEAAARGPHGSVIGFPTFAAVFSMAPFGAAITDPELGIDLLRLVHGEQEFEFLEVVRPGDVLSTTGRLESISTKGRNEILVVRTETVNHHRRTVVRGVFTAVVRG